MLDIFVGNVCWQTNHMKFQTLIILCQKFKEKYRHNLSSAAFVTGALSVIMHIAELFVNLRSKFVFMLGGIIPLIHYQEPVCISYQINLIL